MQSISFKDPVTGDSFSSNTYEVRRNGSGNVLRAQAPSGATAVKMQTTFDGVDDAPANSSQTTSHKMNWRTSPKTCKKV